MTFYSNYNNLSFKVILTLIITFPFALNAQIVEETLFYKEGVRYTSISNLVVPEKDYFFASNLFFNEIGADNSNFELYKMSHDLEKLDSVSVGITTRFNSYDIISKNDSIIIVTIRDTLFDNQPVGEVIIYNEDLHFINNFPLFLPDGTGMQPRRLSLEKDSLGGYFLYATMANMNGSELWFYSAKLNVNFEVLEYNKLSLRPAAWVASNVIKHNNEYYFAALDLHKSQNGVDDWEVLTVEGVDEVFYYPCQIMNINNHIMVASHLRNLIQKRGLLLEFVNNNLEVIKSKYYFEQLEVGGDITYLSSTSAVIKNRAGDRVVIAGQNNFPIGNILNFPKADAPSNLFFVQYDNNLNETWVQVLEGDDFYYMDGGIRYLTDEKIIGSGFKYAMEEDKFYGFIIILDSETGDIISNVNTHSIRPERLKLFPNPVVDQINIELPESDIFDYESYSIMNVHGAVLKQEAMTESAISVGDLPGGQYVLLLHGRGKVAVGKFVKM